MIDFRWSQPPDHLPTRVPLLFTFPPVELLMKELTKLNSPHPYRISYLGPRWHDSPTMLKKLNIATNSLSDPRRISNQIPNVTKSSFRMPLGNSIGKKSTTEPSKA